MTPLQILVAQARLDSKYPETGQPTWDESQRYMTRLAELILANPTGIPENSILVARRFLAAGPQPAPDPSLSIGEATSIFFGEMANQAQEINPLSDRNRGSLAWWLMLTIAIGAIVYLAGISGLAKDVISSAKDASGK